MRHPSTLRDWHRTCLNPYNKLYFVYETMTCSGRLSLSHTHIAVLNRRCIYIYIWNKEFLRASGLWHCATSSGGLYDQRNGPGMSCAVCKNVKKKPPQVIIGFMADVIYLSSPTYCSQIQSNPVYVLNCVLNKSIYLIWSNLIWSNPRNIKGNVKLGLRIYQVSFKMFWQY